VLLAVSACPTRHERVDVNKRIIAGALAVGVTGAGWLPPAHASTTLTIRLPSLISVSENVFNTQHCPASFLSTQLQGADAVVADVHAAAAAHVAIGASWALGVSQTSALHPTIAAKYYPSPCGPAPLGYQDGSTSPGPWTLRPPAGAYWAVFTIQNTANATVTL